MNEPPIADGLSRAASAPMLQMGQRGICLTTPRRHPQQSRQRQRPQALKPLRPADAPSQSSAAVGAAAGQSQDSEALADSSDRPRPPSLSQTGSPVHATPGSTQSVSSHSGLVSSAVPKKRSTATRKRGNMGETDLSEFCATGGNSELIQAVRPEVVRLRKSCTGRNVSFKRQRTSL
jgi:hypothetical protein